MRLLPRHLLLALALVLGQWLAIAHAHAHPALAVDLQCQVCVHAQGLDSGALASEPPGVALPADTLAVLAPPSRAAAAARPRRQQIRGPPVTVA